MKTRFRLITRGSRGHTLYCVDTSTGKRISLGAADRDAAKQIVLAKNQALGVSGEMKVVEKGRFEIPCSSAGFSSSSSS